MKKLRATFLAAAVLCSFAFVAVLASPSNGALVVEQISSAFDSIFGRDEQASATVYASDSVTSLSAFHWLDPIAPSSGDPSKFDASLLQVLKIDICEVTSSDCTLVKSFTSQGSLSEQLRIISNGSTSYYIANWDTSKVKLNNKTYHISVSIGCLVLGSVDLTPDVYMRFGRTWPIKFLIEKDPTLRVRQMRYLGKSASQIVSVLKNEFGLAAVQIAPLLLNDCEPFTQAQIDVAINGVFQNVVIPPTTKIADDATRNALASYDGATGQMIFVTGTPILSGLSINDVFVSEPSPAAPNGFLRKVTSVRRNKQQYIVETVQAAITDAVSQGTLQATGDLLPEDLASATPLVPGVTLQKADTPNGFVPAGITGGTTGGYNFSANIDVTFDQNIEGGDYEGSGYVHVTGQILFNAGYDVGVGAELCDRVPFVCVDRVEGHFGIDQFSDLHVDGHFDGHMHKEYVLARHIFSPITFFIGPIPVVIVPVIDLVAGVDGTAHVEFNFSASLETRSSLGAKWTDPGDGGHGWENVSSLFSVVPSASVDHIQADMNLRAFGKGYAKALLYGIAGPTVAADVGGGAEFHIPGNPVWRVYEHIAADLAFEVSIIDTITLASFHQNGQLLKQEDTIIHSDNMAPIFSNVNGNTILVRLNTPTYLGPHDPFGQGFYDVIDPEGEGTPTLTATIDNVPVQGFPNAVTFTSPGPKVIKIIATDIHSEPSEPIYLNILVFVPPNSIELWPSATTIPAGVQFFATITVHDDTDKPVPCSSLTLNLQVTAPDVATRHGGAGNCVALVRFNQTGVRTLTVTGADPYGAIATKSVNVNVTAAPATPYPEIAEGDLITFSVMSRTGPLSNVCPDPTYLCEAPSDVYFYNGIAGSGDYHMPLFMSLSTTDPADTVIWHCETGSTQVTVSYDPTFDLQTCSPGPSLTERVKVYAIVTDVNGHSIRSESRIYRYLPIGPD
jgi:hypothetical protein